MTFQFPSFEPGTPGTLLDSPNAKQVKAFIEAFNSVQIVKGDTSEMKISDSNIVITINPTDLGITSGSGMTQDEFNTMLLAACDTLEDMIRGGCLYGPLYDNTIEVVNDWYGQTPVETCDPGGTITVLTVP